ncbi:MAG: hypothetical protein ACOH2E_08100 [Candidatus Paracaedibacter sp.]
MLYIVPKSPHPSSSEASSQTSDSNSPALDSDSARASFTAEIRRKGPGLYEMALQDPSHYLKCDLFLEVEDSNQDYEGRVVICHFPNLAGDGLNTFVEEEETLYGALMVQFQMKILEQLFLFCATHYASTLVIFADDAQADDLGIYEDFLAYEDQTLTSSGEKTEMVIPADRQTFEAWLDFMQKTTADFQQTLWHDQKTSPAIRQYLKMRCIRAQPSI